MFSTCAFAQNKVIDRPWNSSNGLMIISTKGSDGKGVYSADYFETTQPVNLGSLVAGGNSTNGNDITSTTTGFNVYIFHDVDSKPSGDPDNADNAVVALTNIPFTIDYSTEQNYFEVNFTSSNGGNQITLPPGKYWMCVFPSVTTPALGESRWNWLNSAVATAHAPMVIDTYGLASGGTPKPWTSLGSYNLNSFTWTLYDEKGLAVVDHNLGKVSVYPNPATDIVNINLPANSQLKKVSLFDISGRQIEAKLLENKSINVSDLAKGVYILSVETDNGVFNQRVIKK